MNGKTFTLKMDVQTANGTFAIVINGEVDGDAIDGDDGFWTGDGGVYGEEEELRRVCAEFPVVSFQFKVHKFKVKGGDS